MPFMLLVKGPGDVVRLLSDVVSDTRKDALDELGRITSNPAFSEWDAEVSVFDLDNATPVILIRPPSGVDEDPPAEEPGIDSNALDEQSAEEVVEEAPLDDTDADLTAVLRKLADEEVSGPSEAEDVPEGSHGPSAPEEPVDAAWADAVMADEASDPRDAAGDPDIAGSSGTEVPEDTPDVPRVQPPMSVRAASETRGEGIVDPVSTDVGGAAPAAPAPETEPVAGTGSWPWSELVVGPSEPEILLDLDDALPDSPEVPADDLVLAAPVEVSDLPAASDFIDLGDLLVDEPVQPEPPGYSVQEATADNLMTCEDCIYVDTCPHKGERDPVTCGSFQWR